MSSNLLVWCEHPTAAHGHRLTWAGCWPLGPGRSSFSVRLSYSPDFFSWLALIFLIDGVQRIYTALRSPSAASVWGLASGALSLAVAASLFLVRGSTGVLLLGITVALWIISHAWELLLAPEETGSTTGSRQGWDYHPDGRLGLAPSPLVGQVHKKIAQDEELRLRFDATWCLVILMTFLCDSRGTHADRLEFRRPDHARAGPARRRAVGDSARYRCAASSATVLAESESPDREERVAGAREANSEERPRGLARKGR